MAVMAACCCVFTGGRRLVEWVDLEELGDRQLAAADTWLQRGYLRHNVQYTGVTILAEGGVATALRYSCGVNVGRCFCSGGPNKVIFSGATRSTSSVQASVFKSHWIRPTSDA